MTISIPLFLLLTIALSTDTFMAGLSYSSNSVCVPVRSMLLLSFTSGLMYTISLLGGKIISSIISVDYLNYLSFTVLFLIAIYKLYDTFPSRSSQIRDFTTDSISEKVNTRNIHVLSPAEAVILATILSIDSITAGLSTGLPPLHPATIFLFTATTHFFAIFFGYLSGHFLAQKSTCPLTWLCTLILFLLAFLKIL